MSPKLPQELKAGNCLNSSYEGNGFLEGRYTKQNAPEEVYPRSVFQRGGGVNSRKRKIAPSCGLGDFGFSSFSPREKAIVCLLKTTKGSR